MGREIENMLPGRGQLVITKAHCTLEGSYLCYLPIGRVDVIICGGEGMLPGAPSQSKLNHTYFIGYVINYDYDISQIKENQKI